MDYYQKTYDLLIEASYTNNPIIGGIKAGKSMKKRLGKYIKSGDPRDQNKLHRGYNQINKLSDKFGKRGEKKYPGTGGAVHSALFTGATQGAKEPD